MARVDDKARYYLEQVVPQLRDFEANEIFSKDEIRTLVRKRTDFEHLVLSPGCTPADFLAYIDWELALDALRAKRCVRLHLKHSGSGHASAARVFQTFDRAVLRHPGSGLLWRRYLAYAAQTKATKRWRRILTRALRLLPGDGPLWVLAGTRAAASGDMDAARGFFMRGCRFCTGDALVWTEYVRAEMQWLAKLAARAAPAGTVTKQLEAGYDAAQVATLVTGGAATGDGGDDDDNIYAEGEGMAFDDEDEDDDEDGDDGDFSGVTQLPKAPAPKKDKVAAAALTAAAVQKLAASPALDGAIPRAIVDAAAKQPFFSPAAAEGFFDVVAAFAGAVPAQPRIAAHVLAVLAARFPAAAATWHCRVRQPLAGVDPASAAFPRALRAALATLREGLAATDEQAALAAKSAGWLDALLQRTDLDAGVRAVLEDTRRKVARAAGSGSDSDA